MIAYLMCGSWKKPLKVFVTFQMVMVWIIFDEVLYLATNLHQAQERSVHICTYARPYMYSRNVEKLYTFCFRKKPFFIIKSGWLIQFSHYIGDHSCFFTFYYYSFKRFPQFWLAKGTRIIHHNHLLMTKFGRTLCLTRKWSQKCRPLQVNVPLTEKTWGRGWVVSIVKTKMADT